MKKVHSYLILLLTVSALAVVTIACRFSPLSMSAQPTNTPTDIPLPTNTPTNIPIPTNTPEPEIIPTTFIGGDCDPETQRINMDEQYLYHISGGTYPLGCQAFCLWVPSGSRLEIGITNFTIDLDIYVDQDLSVLQYSDHGQWQSNDYGTGDESVSIGSPDGRYYIQVCSYETDVNVASDYTLYSDFMP